MAVRSQVDIVLQAVGAGQVARAFGEIRTSIAGVARALLPFATVGGAIAAVPLLVRQASAAAERFSNLKDRINSTLEGAQVLDVLARRSGQTVEVWAQALSNLNRKLAEARGGSEQAYAPFRALGVTVAEFDALPAERQLELLARKLLTAEDRSAAFLAVTQLLGNEAVPKLQAALQRLGVEGYDAVAAAARNAGEVMSDQTINRLKQANDNIDRLKAKATVLSGEIAGGILEIADASTGIVAASSRLTAAEKSFGATSREAARLRLELAQLLFAAGQLKSAEFELSKTPASLPARSRREIDKFTGLPKERGPFDPEIGALKPEQFAAARAKLAADITAALPPRVTPEEAAVVQAAEKLTAETKARAVAEEHASFWITANRAKIEAAVEANRQALLADEERLKLSKMRVAGIDAEIAAATAAAGSDAERKKAELVHAEERSKLLRDIASLEHRITAEKERQARDAQSTKIAAVRAQEIAAQDELEQIATKRRDIERSTILDLSTKRLRLEENTAAYRDQVAALVAIKEAELSLITDVEQRATLEREIARLKRQSAEFGRATAEPSRLEASRIALAGLKDPAAHFQKGEGLEGGANNFLTQLGTDADFAASRIDTTLNGALQGTSDLIYGLSTGALTFREAWSQATAWVGQQFARMAADMVARMIWRSTVERSLIALGVTTHVAGEQTKTAATLSGGALRIGTAIKEALAAVYHGALEAFKAMAGIPYVGPVLGAAAMAAAIAGGLGLVAKIGHADGAIIRGPGGPRDDRIPAMLSNGEAVTRAAVVSRFGEDFFKKLNNGVLDLSVIRGGVARADGGMAIASGFNLSDITIPDRAPAILRQRDTIAEAAGADRSESASGFPPEAPKVNVILVDSRRDAQRIARNLENETYVMDTFRKYRHSI